MEEVLLVLVDVFICSWWGAVELLRGKVVTGVMCSKV